MNFQPPGDPADAERNKKGMNMPRKKHAATDTPTESANDVSAVATAEAPAAEQTFTPQEATPPAYIDGPPVDEKGAVIGPNNPEAKNWGPPYKSIVSTPIFEMGENRRFKQRLFTFKEKPAEEVLAVLKEHGFTYRANEKAWTIPANAETRKLTDELAKEFGGPSEGLAR